MRWKCRCGRGGLWEDAGRMDQGMHRLRTIADFLLVAGFGFVAPVMLAPIGRNWGVMLMGFATFAMSVGFLWDGLRTLGHIHK